MTSEPMHSAQAQRERVTE